MTILALDLERRREDYEEALEAALSALREAWAGAADVTAAEELHRAFRTHGI